MKKLILFFVICSLFCVCGSVKIYAEDLSITQKIERAYDNFMQNEKVVKFKASVKSGWNSFKNWFNNLPGIRHYNNSVYSSKNWKAAMHDMGGEYSPHLKKEGASAQMLREGKKNWDKL
jgi:hypothetical protein